jgi:Mycothiol maleylpyruvate isomerase N-terminal domain
MDSEAVWQHIDRERSWMADLLESLPRAAWEQPSICEGWSVRDVGAHLTFSHARLRDVAWPAMRTGFRYNAMVKYAALRSPLTHEDIVARLRGFVGSRRRAPFVTELEPLLDILRAHPGHLPATAHRPPNACRRGCRGRRPGAQSARPHAAVEATTRSALGRHGHRLDVWRRSRGPSTDAVPRAHPHRSATFMPESDRSQSWSPHSRPNARTERTSMSQGRADREGMRWKRRS